MPPTPGWAFYRRVRNKTIRDPYPKPVGLTPCGPSPAVTRPCRAAAARKGLNATESQPQELIKVLIASLIAANDTGSGPRDGLCPLRELGQQGRIGKVPVWGGKQEFASTRQVLSFSFLPSRPSIPSLLAQRDPSRVFPSFPGSLGTTGAAPSSLPGSDFPDPTPPAPTR